MKTVELFLFGFAAVVDIALLLSLWERINRGRVAIWLTMLVASAAVLHTSVFFRLLIVDMDEPSFIVVDRLLVIAICAGLLALPSAMLHAASRLNMTGVEPAPLRAAKLAWLYVPLGLLPWIMMGVMQSKENDFLSHVGSWKIIYIVWLAVANSFSIALFLRFRGGLDRHGNSFLLSLAVTIAAMTLLVVGYATMTVNTSFEATARLFTTLSPMAVAILFVAYSMRGKLLPLVLERTFAYAAILVGILLIHRLLVTPLAAWLKERFGIDFVLIEGIVLLMIVWAIPSLRARVTESLGYLFSHNVLRARESIRQTSLGLARFDGRDGRELAQWFADDLAWSLQLDDASIVYIEAAGDERAEIIRSMPTLSPNQLPLPVQKDADHTLLGLHRWMPAESGVFERGHTEDSVIEDGLTKLGVLVAYHVVYQTIVCTVFLGNRQRNDRFAREQIHSLSLLVDQFAAIMHDRREVRHRQLTERKLLQQEKLSLLGLLSGSLAHEIRNPLSSIRTITTLVIEDLPQASEARRELAMVVSEIDRLATTANRLLDFARPSLPGSDAAISIIRPEPAIQRMLGVLAYLAKQSGVDLRVTLQCNEVWISANDASLGEIVFNLVKNAIEASRDSASPVVEVETSLDNRDYVLAVRDNGCGIDEAQKPTLFEPFTTDKIDGNGLGLYAVGQRVQELCGSISIHNRSPAGTEFLTRIPMVRK